MLYISRVYIIALFSSGYLWLLGCPVYSLYFLFVATILSKLMSSGVIILLRCKLSRVLKFSILWPFWMHLTTKATIFCYSIINPESPGTASSSANRGRHFSKCFREYVLDTHPFSDRHLIGTLKLNILCLTRCCIPSCKTVFVCL